MCDLCRHSRHDGTCAAFPDGIPEVILPEQQVDHRQPVEGDHDIQFEAREDIDPELLAAFFHNRTRGWAAGVARLEG